MIKRFWGVVGILFLMLLIADLGTDMVLAEEPLQSTNYIFEESSIDAGGLIQSSSSNFQVHSATGALGVGNAASTNYQIDSGTVTTKDPSLTFSVNGSAIFTDFSASTTAYATSTFSVLNYTSHGYSVYIAGDTPEYGSKVIPGMSTTGSPDPGTEQFGINLVANTSPTSFGQNPDNGDFGFGTVTSNYNTSDQYRYVSGEAIAQAPKSSGETTYTISYIVDVEALTPGGRYTAAQTLIVVGTY